MSKDAKKMNKRAPNEIEEQKNVAEGNKSINSQSSGSALFSPPEIY